MDLKRRDNYNAKYKKAYEDKRRSKPKGMFTTDKNGVEIWNPHYKGCALTGFYFGREAPTQVHIQPLRLNFK